jgi:hypothetical protein
VKHLPQFSIALVVLCAAAGVQAQSPAPSANQQVASAPQADAGRGGPPPEAIAACKTLKADQACSFTSPRGAEKGTCGQRDASGPLACRPERRPPPPESLAACKDKKLDDACSFVSPKGSETGSCVRHEPGSALGCRPKKS